MSSSPPIINSALRRVTTTKSDQDDLSRSSSETRTTGRAPPTKVTSLATVSQRHPTKQAHHQHLVERLARTRALIKRQEVTHATSINKNVSNTGAQIGTRIDNTPLRPVIVSVPKKPFERLHASRHAITVALTSNPAQTSIDALAFAAKEVLATSNLAATPHLLAAQLASADLANVALRLPPNIFLQLPPAQKIYQQTQKVENDAQRIVRLTPHPPHLPTYSYAKTLENPQDNTSRLKTNLLSYSHPVIYAEISTLENKQDENTQLKNTLKQHAHLFAQKKGLYKTQHPDTHLKTSLKDLGIAYRAQTHKLAIEKQNALWRGNTQTAQLDTLTGAKKETAISTQRQAHAIGFAQEQITSHRIANHGIGTKSPPVSTGLQHANRVRQGPFRMVSQRGSLKSLGVNETPLAQIKPQTLTRSAILKGATINITRTQLYHHGKLEIAINKTNVNITSTLPPPATQAPTATAMPTA